MRGGLESCAGVGEWSRRVRGREACYVGAVAAAAAAAAANVQRRPVTREYRPAYYAAGTERLWRRR